MKIIETVYKGYKFRSRLEARWAVFFDCMGASWQYEHEGYELDDGTWYLPDFEIGGYIFEVKPDIELVEWGKVLGIAKHKPIVLLIGAPDFVLYPAIHGIYDDVDFLEYMLDFIALEDYEGFGKFSNFWSMLAGGGGVFYGFDDECYIKQNIKKHLEETKDYLKYYGFRKNYEAAVLSARQTRF